LPKSSRWRAAGMGFLCRQRELVADLASSQSYLDSGSFQPIQIRGGHVCDLNEGTRLPKGVEVNAIYKGRRDADRRSRAAGLAHRTPRRERCRLGASPEPLRPRCEIRVSPRWACKRQGRALSPGNGFGPGGRRQRLRAVRPTARREREADPTGELRQIPPQGMDPSSVTLVVRRSASVESRRRGPRDRTADAQVRRPRRGGGLPYGRGNGGQLGDGPPWMRAPRSRRGPDRRSGRRRCVLQG